MNRLFPLLLFVLTLQTSLAQSESELAELASFAKTYGHIKYFHPSDEAQSIDWDKFATLGVQTILENSDQAPLADRLENLFRPIAPTARILPQKAKPQIAIQALARPSDTADYQLTYWQHLGIQLDDGNRNIYKSVRVNSQSEPLEIKTTFGGFAIHEDGQQCKGKAFRLQARVKNTTNTATGHLWLRVDRSVNAPGFFANMDESPILETDWKTYEISGTIDADAQSVVFGFFLSGYGSAYVDDLSLEIQEGDQWTTIVFEDFNKEKELALNRIGDGPHEYKILGKDDPEKQCIHVFTPTDSNQPNEALFGHTPKTLEVIRQNIGNGLALSYPVSLYTINKQTFPAADKNRLQQLQSQLTAINMDPDKSLTTRMAIVINAWNVLEHFYPYFDEVEVDWEKVLIQSLKDAAVSQNGYELLQTLRAMTAKLQDGHIRVWAPYDRGFFAPPIYWEWVEDQVVITQVMDDANPLTVGTVIKNINGQSAAAYFDQAKGFISAGTKGWHNYRAAQETLTGAEGSVLELTTQSGESISLKRTMPIKDHYEARLATKKSFEVLADGIYYLNLDIMKWPAIEEKLPELATATAIICDLRGYPKGNHQLISHLLTEADTSSAWMRVPQMVYPRHQQNPTYEHHGWAMPTASPHLNAKVIFITNGSAISYAESYMGLIDHYELATIIGQPTAGANGNVNRIKLPGGYGISFTGMKVVRHDGGQHHAKGIQPDIRVEKTIKGVQEGRDEFLERALELIKG